MDYRILKNNENEFFIEITRETFRTRIEFEFTPEDDFRGVAISCSYDFKGHPIGYLKDNGLYLTKITGHSTRPLFHIDETSIQAGPTLVDNFEINKNFQKEGFSTNELISGFHPHIGQKKLGNYVLGFTKKNTLSEIAKKYKEEYTCQYAIKLPGEKRGGFYFRSSSQTVSEGCLPIKVALIFESKIDNLRNL